MIDPPIDPADKPHDAFVKRVFTQPEAAAVELRAALPAAVAERLDWSTLRVVPINFVDPSLDRRESDILYAIDIIDAIAARRIAALGPQIDLVYQELGAEAVHTLLRYVDSAFRKKPTLRAILRRVISEEKRRMYISVYDEMRAEGKAEGKLEFLVQLLSKRGLVLDDERRARLEHCTDEAQLQRWFDRALTATTVAAVFDEP